MPLGRGSDKPGSRGQTREDRAETILEGFKEEVAFQQVRNVSTEKIKEGGCPGEVAGVAVLDPALLQAQTGPPGLPTPDKEAGSG